MAMNQTQTAAKNVSRAFREFPMMVFALVVIIPAMLVIRLWKVISNA